jgi:subfamily B ATP-binding cassette protein MsbA
VLIVRLISKRLRRLSHSIQSSMGEMTHVLEEAIQGNQVIKLFGGQAYESGRFREISNWVRRYHMKRVAAASISSPAGQMVMVLGLAGMLYFASIQSLNDQLSVGSFVSFIAAIVMLLSPLKKLIRINEQLQQGLAAAESVFDLVDEPSEADQGQRPIERLSGQIHFERIHFSYQGASEPALRDIDLKIATGETVALVGPSGSGKSTLASLLPRFYELNQGRILLDGIDCREMPLAQLRNNIALVSQDVTLFNDTVEANIAYGLMRGTPRDKVLEAARAAHAIEFIEQMPDGIETLIGEDGTRLSGGQRQRLAIARALLKDAPILILDEATSALDNESERYIQEALQTLTQNRTTLIIAHRLSTIESADRILVMEQGRIIEQGDHTSLMARNGVYRTLYDTQFAS